MQEIKNDVHTARVVVAHLHRITIDQGNESTIINREVAAAVIVLILLPLPKKAKEEREAGLDLKSSHLW
jgi:hypothetical protein